MKLALGLVTATMTVLGTLASAPAATAEDPAPQVSVVWPEVTRFNPTTTTYDAVVTNNGTGHVYATFVPDADQRQPNDATEASATGHVTPSNWREGGGVVQIWTCEQWYAAIDGWCTLAATSPHLTVYSQLSVWDAARGYDNGMKAGVNHHRLSYAPGTPDVATPTATWELLDSHLQPLATPVTGTVPAADLARDEQGQADMSFDIPADTPNGAYYLDVRMSVDDPDFGHLEGDLASAGVSSLIGVYVDTVGPKVTVGKVPSLFYPVYDDYLDDVEFHIATNEQTSVTLDIANAAGVTVAQYESPYVGPASEAYFAWYGTDTRGRLAAEGTYTLTVTATDRGGNRATWTGHVRISHQRLRYVTASYTVAAAPYVSGKLVGKCSTLARKPHRALGFYSESKCKGSSRSNVVVANFGMYIPKAFQNHYSWARVDVTGGPATASSRNYLVSAVVRPDGKLVGRRELGKGNRTHTGARVSLIGRNVVFDRTTAHPYLIWSAGLTDGSRYNVRSFTVSVNYQVLR